MGHSGWVFGTEWRDRATGFETRRIDDLERQIKGLMTETRRLRTERQGIVTKIYCRVRYPRCYTKKGRPGGTNE